MADFYPLRRVENFDYPDGTRFWDAYDQVPYVTTGQGAGPQQQRLQRYGSPLETNANGQAVIGRGPYHPGEWTSSLADYGQDLFTGYGQGLTTGLVLNNFESETGEFGLYLVQDERTEFYEVRLSAGSPGPYGTGILRPSSIRDLPIQVCWNQAEGVWAEFIYADLPEVIEPETPILNFKRVLPLAPPSADARTLGLRSRSNPITGEIVWDFRIDGVIVAEAIGYDGLPTGATDAEPTIPGGPLAPQAILFSLLVINPVPVASLEPWGGRVRDYYAISWGGTPEYFEAPPGGEDAVPYFYSGERYPVFDWIHTWHDFALFPDPIKKVTPPLHQTRADFLAAGGAYRYRTARTRQSSIWQNAHL